MTIDLSFAKDQDWRTERERAWRPIGRSLVGDLDRKTIMEVEHYFLTGEFLDGGRLSDGACFSWFPLQTPEGWDYVFENIVLKSDVFCEKFYYSLRSMESRPITAEQELAMWDYFHPKTYQPVIRSRVPVGRKKDIVEIKVDVYKVAENIASGLRGYLEYESYGLWPKWCQRLDYFFSFLPHLLYDKNERYRRRDPVQLCYTQIRLFFTVLYDEACWAKVEDPEFHRRKFAENFKIRFESMDNLPERMLELWAEAKGRSAK